MIQAACTGFVSNVTRCGDEMKPILVDLYCKAGGASMGYYLAGFDVIGIDIEAQKNYPFPFLQLDAILALSNLLDFRGLTFSDGNKYYLADIAAFHASPPCQAYSLAGIQWRKSGVEYPDLLEPTRELLIKTDKPFVIENVPGAPLNDPVVLNGPMFQMRLRRTRLFETSFQMPLILRPPEEKSNFRMGIPVNEGDIITPVGHFSNVDYARKVMEIDWMTGSELTQAIPPKYTKFIGEYLIEETISPDAVRKEIK